MDLHKNQRRPFRFVGLSILCQVMSTKRQTAVFDRLPPQHRPHRHADPRLRSRARYPATFSRSRSVGLCIPRSDDGSHRRLRVGGPHASRRVDPRQNRAYRYDVGFRGNADPLFQATAGCFAASRVLRCECPRLAQGANSPGVRLRISPAPASLEESPHRCHPRPTPDRSGRAASASGPQRSTSASSSRSAHSGPVQPKTPCKNLPAKRRGQEDDRAAFSRFHRDDIRKVAPAITLHASAAHAGRGRKGYARGA